MNKPLTNLEFLKELEKRLPDFNKNELNILGEIIMIRNPQREKALKFLKETHPKVHDLVQETIQEAKKRKVEQLAEEIKKFLQTKPKESPEEEISNRCQECNAPIVSQPDQKGRKILEFYGKWTGQEHKIVCQNCLEKK